MVRRLLFWRHPFSGQDLSSYLDGRLLPSESARLEQHLASCEGCRRHLAELRAVVEGLRALPTAPAPRSFALRPGQVEAERGVAPVAPVTGLRALAFGPAGAAVAALLLLAVLVGVDLGTAGDGGVEQEEQAMQLAGEAAAEAVMPSLSAAPAPTVAPAPGPRDAAGHEKAEAGVSEYDAETPAPAEEAAAAPPPAEAREGDGAGRWVLRGFEGAAAAAFVLAVAAIVWRRRRGERH